MAAISSSITLQLPERDNMQVYAVVINGSHSNVTIWDKPLNLDHTIMTTVTKHPDVITRWIEGVYAEFGSGLRRFVGMEVEIDFIAARARMLQFCVGNRCLVIQLVENQPCPPSLHQFMCDHHKFVFVCSLVAIKVRPLKMAVGISADESKMIAIVDLSEYSEPIIKKWGILNSFRPGGDEGVVDVNWGGPNAYPLSPAQVHYACIDAFLNIHIAKIIWNLN